MPDLVRRERSSLVPAPRSPRARHHLKSASLDAERVPSGQGQRCLAAGASQYSLERGTRHAHPPGSFGLSHALNIGQAKSLQFFMKKPDGLQLIEGYSCRLEDGRARRSRQPTTLARTGQGLSVLASATTTTSLAAFRFWLFSALPPWQVDQLVSGFSGDLLQFCPAQAGLVNRQICALGSHDGEAGSPCSLSHVPPVAHKDFTHVTSPF